MISTIIEKFENRVKIKRNDNLYQKALYLVVS